MPRVCTVCAHPQRDAIDRALVAGTACRETAALYRVSADSVERHAAKHLPKTLVEARHAADIAHADSLLAQVQDLQRRTLDILTAAEEGGDGRVALGAIREARGNIELLAKLTGELDERAQVNLVIAPEWLAIRAAILTALAAYPDARMAVASRLMTLDAGGMSDGAGV